MTARDDSRPTADAPAMTHRRVLAIAIPIVISNASIPILGAVDTGVVGQMGEAVPIGAVGVGAVVLSALYWIFGFLRMGTTGLAAQAIGQGDRAEVSALLIRALMIGAVAGLLLIAGQVLLFRGAFALSPASAQVEALARDYMGIRIWSAPAAIALYGITGWLIAQERTWSVLAVQLLMNGMNIGLDLWFVLGLGWGVQGVAVATVMAELSGLGLGLWLCRDAFRAAGWRDPARVFDMARLRHMAVVNGDIMIRSVLLLSIFVSFTFWSSGIGDVTLAANQVLIQFLNITAHALDGFAFAAEALVGQAVGARALGGLRRSIGLTALWGGVICLGMALVFWAFGPAIIDTMTTAPDVRAAAATYLPWLIAAPLVGCAAWMLDGVFIGATATRDMRNMMALSTAIYFGAALALTPFWGNHGLWAALHVSFIARAVTLGARYPALERRIRA